MERLKCRTNTRTLGTSIERFLVPRDEGLAGLQETLDKTQMAHWVSSLAPWQVIAHLTWEDAAPGSKRVRTFSGQAQGGISVGGAARCYERFMSKHLPHLSYFYSVEPNPSRYGTHIHALWADAGNVYRKEAYAAWFKRFGRARIEPVKCINDVSNYSSKYVTKPNAWWNVKLQWHRVQALHNADFVLRDDAFGNPIQSTRPPHQNASYRILESRSEGELEISHNIDALPWRQVGPGLFAPVESSSA